MISMEKKYKTRDGWPVRILCTDRKDEFPVVGLIVRDDNQQVASWLTDGRMIDSAKQHPFDLIEVRPRIKRTVWLNIYPDAQSIHNSAEHAAKFSPTLRIACVRVDIDCEEGEGLTPCKPPFPENVRR